LAQAIVNTPDPDPVLQVVFQSMESFANALTNVAAFGLYSLAGTLLLPALFATLSYPRWLAWLGSAAQ
jgi:cell shape-determining protein MreD